MQPAHPGAGTVGRLNNPRELSEPPDLQGLEQQWRGRSTVTTDNPGAHAHHPGASVTHPDTHDHIELGVAAAAPQTDVAGA